MPVANHVFQCPVSAVAHQTSCLAGSAHQTISNSRRGQLHDAWQPAGVRVEFKLSCSLAASGNPYLLSACESALSLVMLLLRMGPSLCRWLPLCPSMQLWGSSPIAV